MARITTHKEQPQYLYNNPSWLYDYVYAFFYGFILNNNYVYDAKLLKATYILPITSYTYNSLRQHSAQAFGNMDYEYDYFRNVNKLILQNTYSSISMASRSLSLRQTATKQGLGYVWNANASSNDIRYKFTGKERDGETGFDYTSTNSVHSFGARYYASDLSIWLSVDPLAAKYPSLSPYAYVANNPIMLVDPDGMRIDDYFNKKESI